MVTASRKEEMRLPFVASCEKGTNDVSLLTRASGVVDAHDFARSVDGRLDFGHLTLSLEVVAACSLRCPGCWVNMVRSDMWTASPNEVMPSALFNSALSL